MKRRKEPTVVVFQEPGKTSSNSKKKKLSTKINVERSATFDEDEMNFKKIAQEVREFGATGFTKKEKRKFEQQKAQSLGAKAPKRQKVPYPILMQVKKQQKQKEENRIELEKAMGIFKKRKSKKSSNDLPMKVGRWVDNSRGLDSGKQKKGIHTLHRKDIATFKKKK